MNKKFGVYFHGVCSLLNFYLTTGRFLPLNVSFGRFSFAFWLILACCRYFYGRYEIIVNFVIVFVLL